MFSWWRHWNYAYNYKIIIILFLTGYSSIHSTPYNTLCRGNFSFFFFNAPKSVSRGSHPYLVIILPLNCTKLYSHNPLVAVPFASNDLCGNFSWFISDLQVSTSNYSTGFQWLIHSLTHTSIVLFLILCRLRTLKVSQISRLQKRSKETKHFANHDVKFLTQS